MQTLAIVYRVSSLAPQNDNTGPRATVVVCMGLPDAKRIIAADVGQAAHHITIMHNRPINHGECLNLTNSLIAAMVGHPPDDKTGGLRNPGHAIID